MAKALKGKPIYPRIHVEGDDRITYAVSCRHCVDPICVKSCIAGAISVKDGIVKIDENKCVGCLTCVLVCPYGSLAPGENGTMQKCELCTRTHSESRHASMDVRTEPLFLKKGDMNDQLCDNRKRSCGSRLHRGNPSC